MRKFSQANWVGSSVGKSVSVLGAVGLSAIAILGAPEAAKAVDIFAGEDLLFTPADGSSFFDFGGPIGIVELMGVPLGGGKTDTIVERKEDCTFVAGSCHIDIEMTALSLASIDPVNVGGFNYDVWVTPFDPDPSLGEMWINDDGTFQTVLDVHFETVFHPLDGGPDIGPIVDWKTFDALGIYSLSAAAQGKFVILDAVVHDTGDGRHTVHPIPEPATAIASILFGLGGLFGLKRERQS